MDINMVSIGKRIKETRLRKNLKHADMYELCGIASGAMSMIENGKRVPSAIILYNIAKALDVSADWLITGDSTDAKIPKFCELEETLLRSFQKLNIDDQEEVLEFIQLKLELSNRKKRAVKSSDLSNDEGANMIG